MEIYQELEPTIPQRKNFFARSSQFLFSTTPRFLFFSSLFIAINLIALSLSYYGESGQPKTVKKEISAGGGQVKSPDKKITLEAPSQEKEKSVAKTETGGEVRKYEVAQASLGSLPGKLTIFDLSAVAKEVSPETEKGKAVTEFTQPLVLTYSYDDEDLKGLVEDSLHFIYLNEETQEWEEIETQVNTEEKLLTAEITHLSTFGVSGDPAVIVPETIKAFQTDLFSGTATFSFSIGVPAGVGGLTPGLSLTYSSNAVNAMIGDESPGTWVGMGWNLDLGYVSVQQRDSCSSDEEEPWFSLVLNGVSSSLIKNGGDICSTGPGVYHTRNESFMKIEMKADGRDTPYYRYWQVTDKNGTVYEFGRNTRVHNYHGCEYTNVKWPLEKIIDTHGNTITIEYQTSQPKWTHPDCPKPSYTREAYPERILYTTNSRAGDNLNEYQIVFNLEDKGYPTPGELTGEANWETKRLKEIKIMVWDPDTKGYQNQRRYQFTYDNNSPTWRAVHTYYNLLTRITESGTGNESLPPLSFRYTPMTNYCRYLIGNQCRYCSGQKRYFLTKAENGYGGKAEYSYQKQTFCHSSDGMFERQIVVSKKDSSGQSQFGPDLTTTYNYESTAIERKDKKRFLGFTKVTVVTPQNKITTSFSANDRDYYDPLNGRSLSTEVRDKNDKLFSKTQNKYGTKRIIGKKVRWPYLIETINTVWDGNSSKKQTKNAFEYDNYGNQTKTLEYGDLGKNGDERTSEIKYSYNPSKNILAKVKSQRTYKGLSTSNSVTISYTTNYYDGNTNLSDPPSIGDLTESRTYHQFPGGEEGNGFYAVKTKYNRYGSPVETEDALGRKTKTAYHPSFPAFSIKVTNAKNQSEQAEYNFQKGVVTKVIDANGIATEYRYDSFGRLVKMIGLGDSVGSPRTEYVYHEGNPSWVLAKTKNDPGFIEAKTFNDGLGRTLQVQTEGAGGKTVVTNTHYNEMGQADKTILPYFVDQEIGGLLTPDWNKPLTLTEYDSMGRAIKVTDAQGKQTKTSYDDFTTTVVDAKGHQKTTEKDAYGNLVKVIEYQGEYPDVSPYTTTTYEYDMLGNLTRINTPKEITTTVSYDNLGRKTQMNDPDLGTWKYEYDSVGNLIKQTDAKNQEIKLAYDELNRLVRKSYPDNSAVLFEYDSGANAIGKRIKIADSSGETRYAYDDRGRVSREEVLIGDQTFGFDFTYDQVDRLKTLTYPDGEIITYTYNNLGQLVRVEGQSVYLAEAQYEQPSGKMTAQVLGDTTQTSYGYDILQRLTSLSSQSSAGALQGLSYAYDPVGNITQISNQIETLESTSFDYDFLNRLTSASGPYQANYAYDEVGNILTKNEGDLQLALEYADPAHRHAPSKVSDQNYVYDANGNLISDGKRTIIYNFDNRPVEIEYEGTETTLAYNGDGRRVKKVTTGGTSSSFASGWSEISKADLNEASDAKAALRFIQSYCNLDSAILSEKISGWWQTYILGVGGVNFSLEEDESYYLYLTDGCVSPENQTILYPSESYQVVLENGEVTKHYMAGGKAIAVRTDGDLYFMHTDHLGSTTFVTNVAGEETASQKYYPYGLTREVSEIEAILEPEIPEATEGSALEGEE
jgi:YD repeat-containing protein